MNDKIYQLIFDAVSDFLPEEWTDLIVYLEHGEEAYSYCFYVKTHGKYIKCFDLNIPEEKLLAAFARIEKKVSTERNKLDKCWSNMTMITVSYTHLYLLLWNLSTLTKSGIHHRQKSGI